LLGATPLLQSDVRAGRAAVLEQALNLHHSLLDELAADDDALIDIAIIVHSDEVELELPKFEPVGGALLTLGSWPHGWQPTGVFASRAALRGLESLYRRTLILSDDELYRITRP
ncbi:MAG: hypothetical protein AAGC55_31950, partial [Myxococcota bacterium]